jgi:outer membrane receptor for ferrienterochelin and colicins
MKNIIYLIILLLPSAAFAQDFRDTLQNKQDSAETNVTTETIVVTGTRTDRNVNDIPVSTSVITGKEINATGSVRLSEILASQTGLYLINFLGTGVQLQGLDPDYTLILLDGEPLIGRNGGTLDLNRISLNNISRIEIVKGPSSSLYGSEALGGVINLITNKKVQAFSFNAGLRYGTYNSMDANADISVRHKKISSQIFVNRNSSSGYDFTHETESKTAPEYYNYTLSLSGIYELNNTSSFKWNGRIYFEKIKNTVLSDEGNGIEKINDNTDLIDMNLSLDFTKQFQKMKLTGKLYSSRYDNKNLLTYRSNGEEYFKDYFDQYYYKAEVQSDYNLLNSNVLTSGAGVIQEKVIADRIYGESRTRKSYFGFIQDEWHLTKSIDALAGLRYDYNTDYEPRLSPKLAVLFKPLSWVIFRVSAGSGFKAPTFQQLYLDFTNPQVGYSVFGTFGFQESFQQLLNSGQIQITLMDPAAIYSIRPEYSTAFNFDVNLSLFGFLNIKVNLFRNNLNDLIDIASVAVKTNGQRVFSYVNINKVYTQGIETEAEVRLFNSLKISIGYNYLQAKDEKVLEDIKNKKILKIGSTGVLRPVYEQEYGGLFNRPHHSGTIKLFYENSGFDFNVSLTGNIFGRIGYSDKNMNGILDNDNEYLSGYRKICSNILR